MINLFAQPLGILLKFIYNLMLTIDSQILSAYSLAIIITTIILKLIILPLTLKQAKSMKKMQDLQPKLKELQKKYKNDNEKLTMKTLELYKEHNANPVGGFLPLLLQFPIIIGFYNVLKDPITYVFKDPVIYANVNRSFLWIKDLGFTANHIFENGIVNGFSLGINIPFVGVSIPFLAILAGFTSYLSSKVLSKASVEDKQVQGMQQTMMLMMPFMIIIFSFNMPEGLILYWIIGNIFQIIQQFFSNKTAERIKGILKQMSFIKISKRFKQL